MNSKKKSVEKIMRDIKNIKIQGAKNIAKAAYCTSYNKFPAGCLFSPLSLFLDKGKNQVIAQKNQKTLKIKKR